MQKPFIDGILIVCVSVQLAAWLVISHNVDFNYFNCMQNVQFTICFASCARLLVPHSIGRICFLFISSQKILRNENCKLHAFCCCCCCYGKLAQVLLSALGKVLRQQRCVWLTCLTSGWQIDLYFVQMNRMIFIALQSGYNFIEYFWHVVILFLTQFVPSWRYIYAYKRCLL